MSLLLILLVSLETLAEKAQEEAVAREVTAKLTLVVSGKESDESRKWEGVAGWRRTSRGRELVLGLWEPADRAAPRKVLRRHSGKLRRTMPTGPDLLLSGPVKSWAEEYRVEWREKESPRFVMEQRGDEALFRPAARALFPSSFAMGKEGPEDPATVELILRSRFPEDSGTARVWVERETGRIRRMTIETGREIREWKLGGYRIGGK